MDASLIRQDVNELREKQGFTGVVEHCFAPWYLHQRYQVPEVKAFAQSSDGNYDFGIDAFHLQGERLVLVQAKFTDKLQLITKGFKDLEKVLPEVFRSFAELGTETTIQNKVLVNLRAVLGRLSPEQRAALTVELQVLHLSNEDDTVLANQLRAPMLRLSEVAQSELPDNTCQILQVGPSSLGPIKVVVAPPEESVLRLSGSYAFIAGEKCQMITGIGQLSGLVDLYRVRRDGLFSKNVRYFLTSKKNTEKGPAGKMRATLKEMCVDGKGDPERFAMYHNGITIFARKATIDGEHVRLRDPFVLNGCQTIKNAFLFRYDKHIKDRLKADLWERIAVPVRIIDTADEALVRAVTVNNNRQNAMSSAALRSNDPVQIRLEQRFKERRIMYQRQEGAFDAVWGANPQLLEDEFENTQGTWVDLHELSRAIAAALGKVSWALHPNDLFESDKAYDTCFDEKRTLRSIVFLTFLQNLHDVLSLILKMDLNLSPKGDGPKPTKFMYETMCLICRHLASSGDDEFVVAWGTKLWGKKPAFREAVRKLIASPKSGIRSALASQVMTLQSKDAESINAAFEQCQKVLKLKDNIDPFVTFANLDAEVEASTGDDE